MGIELGILFLILLSRAQRLFPGLPGISPPGPVAPPRPASPPPRAAPPPPPPPRPAPAPPTAHVPPPWPQVVPAGLPPFPSGAWQPASPVTSAMVARAFQLLPTLWASGPGTFKVEKTGPQWVTYMAAPTRAADNTIKNGVVAYTTSLQPSSASAPISVTPGRALPPGATVPASSAAPSSAHATLRQGSTGPSVIWLQQTLHIPADGKFGPGTKAAVVAFQASHGLTADGVVGPQTWAALGGSAQAA